MGALVCTAKDTMDWYEVIDGLNNKGGEEEKKLEDLKEQQ